MNTLISKLQPLLALLIFFIYAIPSEVSAQSAETVLAGIVSNSMGSAIQGATVRVESQNVKTDDAGAFKIVLKRSGKFNIQISSVGYEQLKQNLEIREGSENRFSFTLKSSSQALQQVEILGRKSTSYKTDYSFGATKTATYLKDIPQSVSIITKELITDRQIERAWDATKMMSGVNRYSNYNDIVIRGFRSGENQPRLINGLRAAFGYFDQPVTANLERIEVVKGPASALFGNAVPGGTINFVTKKPLAENRYGLNFTGGSFNTFRGAADFTGPINKDSTILYRFNAAYSNAQSFRNLQGGENYVIAPSFSFLPSEKTRINVDLVYNQSNSKIDRGQPVFGASSASDIYATPIALAIGAPNDFYKVKNLQLNLGLTHDFNENLSFNASYMKFGWDEKLLEHRTSNTFAVDGNGKEIPSKVAMQVFDRLQRLSSDNLNAFFRYKVKHGQFKHSILLGYDYIQQIRPVGSTQNVARGYRNAANTGIITSYNPAKKSDYLLDANGNPVPNVAHFDLVNVQYPIRNTNGYFFTATNYAASKYAINAVYAQDQMSIGKLQVLLGLRQEFYADYTNHNESNETKVIQRAFIPRLGLTYTLHPQINVYGTYTEGYQPQSASTFSNPNNGGPFSPSTSNMIEFGAKASLFEERLAANISVYKIKQKNVLVSANDPINTDLLRQRGEEQSSGFEVELIGNILPNLSVNANYAYNEATIVQGLPAEEGMQKANAPKHLSNLWLKYDIYNGDLAGLGFGGGLNYSSKRNTEILSLQLPAYSTVDVAAYYTFQRIRLSMNFNNVFNQKYWIAGYNYTRIFPGEPRNIMFSLMKIF
ncbi:TonB-dependent siderophore receptor [Pedobacter aquatilis]|uniref:TonB-dependent siderophore receptor n=1 Tax=Pedobacter aquatilis TaxID=351343 RepID=UPI00292EA6A6|nr:TonB-dependent siderophore receptor [Pedobacter aquatilis]